MAGHREVPQIAQKHWLLLGYWRDLRVHHFATPERYCQVRMLDYGSTALQSL
jgi:hypothetical protein